MAIYDKFGSVRIPKGFFDDHSERDLPAPVIEKTTANHYWIDDADPALPELVSDAKHYAGKGCDCGPTLASMAAALLRALA